MIKQKFCSINFFKIKLIDIGLYTKMVFLDIIFVKNKKNNKDYTYPTNLFLSTFNPLTAKLFNLNFHPLEVSENYSDLTKWRSTVFKYCWFMSHFIFNMFNRWYLMCW